MKLKFNLPIRRAMAWSVALAAIVPAVADAASTKILSPGPQYYGNHPVEAAYVYSFMDVRPEFVSDRFRAAVRQRLCDEFRRAGVRCEQLWFSETPYAERLRDDPKSFTFSNSISIPIGGVMNSNADKDGAFAPTHRITAFPTGHQKWGNGAMLDVRWEVHDASTHYLEWAVYTRTPVISSDMKDDDADAAAASLVDTIVGEMRARKVIP